MTLETLKQNFIEWAERFNSNALFNPDNKTIHFTYSPIEGKDTFIESTIEMVDDTLYISPFKYTSDSWAPHWKIYLGILEHWINFSKIMQLNKVEILNLDKWIHTDITTFLNLSITAGFKRSDERNSAVLIIDDYVSLLDTAETIENFLHQLEKDSTYGRFEYNIWDSIYDDDGPIFFRVTCSLNSFFINLKFHYEDGIYYLNDIKNLIQREFTPENLLDVLHHFYANILEEQQLKILLEPPCEKLGKFLEIFPTPGNNKPTQEMMSSLITKGYTFNEIEEYSILLRKEHIKTREKSNYYLSDGLEPIYIRAGDSLGYGRLRFHTNDFFIKFPKHFVLITTSRHDNYSSDFEIFDTREEMIMYIQKSTEEVINKLLDS